MAGPRTLSNTLNLLLGIQLLGDMVFSLLGLMVGYFLRFETPLRFLGMEDVRPPFSAYVPLFALGTLLLIGGFAYMRLYDVRLLLRPHRCATIILRGTFFWFLLFLSTSLILKFEPPISRLFVAASFIATLGLVVGWRFLFFRVLSQSRWRDRITQRVAIIGWNREAANLSMAIALDVNHPYLVAGVISTTGTPVDVPQKLLGQVKDLEGILAKHQIDIAVVADLDLTRDELLAVATICERHYVEFKVIPSFFQIFLSNLHLQSVSGISLLGVEDLPLDALLNRLLKRTIDLVGGAIGLVASLPLVAVLTFLIKRQSPGPVLFYQERVGRGGQRFKMYKLRSMVPGAHLKDHESQSTLRDDSRVTPIGAFMRRWNLDELPQFWNVLCGDMSLVGPRPERTYHVEQLSHQIPHYNPRHSVKPGMTGWAQVNGLRGDTSLVERVKYDLYYIENWSVWFDVQILLLTFVRRNNAY